MSITKIVNAGGLAARLHGPPPTLIHTHTTSTSTAIASTHAAAGGTENLFMPRTLTALGVGGWWRGIRVTDAANRMGQRMRNVCRRNAKCPTGQKWQIYWLCTQRVHRLIKLRGGHYLALVHRAHQLVQVRAHPR